jgi:anti-sigma regulatory factor (Ser/Thr protein kinase)
MSAYGMGTLFRRKETHRMRTLHIEASVGKLSEVLCFADEIMDAADVGMKTRMQISLALEELFVNVAQYAYKDRSGSVTIEAGMQGDRFTVVLSDLGIPYNPLEHKDPDITQSADERPVGGLGTFMVRKTMDTFEYRYEDGKNVTTIQKIVG